MPGLLYPISHKLYSNIIHMVEDIDDILDSSAAIRILFDEDVSKLRTFLLDFGYVEIQKTEDGHLVDQDGNNWNNHNLAWEDCLVSVDSEQFLVDYATMLSYTLNDDMVVNHITTVVEDAMNRCNLLVM